MGFPSALCHFNKLIIWSFIDFLYYFFSKSLLASSAEISFMVSPQHLMPQFSQVQSINTLTIAPHFSQSTILSILTPPYWLNLLNKLISSSIVSKSPFSKSRDTQVYRWFSKMCDDKLLMEFFTADNWTKTSLQYASFSIILVIPFIWPLILFNLLIISFFSSGPLLVILLQQLLSISILLFIWYTPWGYIVNRGVYLISFDKKKRLISIMNWAV